MVESRSGQVCQPVTIPTTCQTPFLHNYNYYAYMTVLTAVALQALSIHGITQGNSKTIPKLCGTYIQLCTCMNIAIFILSASNPPQHVLPWYYHKNRDTRSKWRFKLDLEKVIYCDHCKYIIITVNLSASNKALPSCSRCSTTFFTTAGMVVPSCASKSTKGTANTPFDGGTAV